MKYRVGDKVRVRKNLVAGREYGNDVFIPDMEKYLGKTMTIDRITVKYKYKLKEDVTHCNWTDEMLEDVEDISIFVRDNKVIAKKGNKVGIAKCSPEDEFDIFTGARLAIDRLEEKCKPYSWLKVGMNYYLPNLYNDTMYIYTIYYNDENDKRMKERGFVFKTKEEAINCAKKMLEVIK